jgi:hypothetical protein
MALQLASDIKPREILWGAKVLHFLGVDVEVVATALEIAVWAEFDDFPHK